MARSDAEHLEALKTARDAVVDGLAAGESTVSYTIRGRVHEVEPSSKLLNELEKSIEIYERKVARPSRHRLAKLKRASRAG